jgi:hypothetical protein
LQARQMSVLEPKQKLFLPVDTGSTSESATIGLIGPDEFDMGRSVVAGLEAYPTFSDWLDCREGLQIGLSLAGVEATLIRVRLAGFMLWCDLTACSPSLCSLDAFAASVDALRRAPLSAVVAEIDSRQFAAHCGRLAAFEGQCDYGAWSERRRRIRERAAAAGLRVVEQPVRIGKFVDWCACVGEAGSEAALDTYAALLHEYLVESGERWGENCHMTI